MKSIIANNYYAGRRRRRVSNQENYFDAPPPRTALIVIVCSACYARRDVGKHGIDNWEITVEDDVWRGYILAHNSD